MKWHKITFVYYLCVIIFSGRGRGDGYIQRGTSYEEGGGGFGRPPNTNRADGWEEV